MAIKESEFVWHNGHLIPWDEAKIHVMAHVVNYGSSVFEGIRCYHTPKGPAIFRLRDHTLRLLQSCKIYRIDVDFSSMSCIKRRSIWLRPTKCLPATFAPSCCAAMGRWALIPLTRPPRFTLPTTYGASIWAAADCEDGVDVCVRLIQPPGPKHHADHGQGRCQLHELTADQDGSHCERL